jgi:acetylglutamate kinase
VKSIAVLKLGGEVVGDPGRLDAVLVDAAALVQGGVDLLVVHGAGPQMADWQARLEIPTRMVAGQRVTDPDTLEVVKAVLGGQVSVDLVAAALGAGMRAVGISGVSARTVQAHRRPPRSVPGHDELVDYGLVGDVVGIDAGLVEHLWRGGFVPVLNPIGIEAEAGHRIPQVYNINADTVTAAIAQALRAEHVVLVTAVGGIRRDRSDPSTRLPRLTMAQAQAAIADGTIAGGMIPKVEEALVLLRAGVGAVHIVGPQPGTLRATMQEPGQVGTVLVRD